MSLPNRSGSSDRPDLPFKNLSVTAATLHMWTQIVGKIRSGGSGIEYPAFYSYAYPAPEGFSKRRVRPAEASWSNALGEFLLPYDAVRTATSPDDVLLDFLQSTYEAAAECAHWDRGALERELVPPDRGR